MVTANLGVEILASLAPVPERISLASTFLGLLIFYPHFYRAGFVPFIVRCLKFLKTR